MITILIIVGSFIYSFNLNNELFWDDDDWIINNVYVHSVSWENVKFLFSNNVLAGVGLQSNYYRPFLFFTFAFNWVISETKPFLWHLVSNSIHIANAVLVFVLFRKYVGNLVSFLTALFFVVHPLNTEAVAYISGRGDPLSALFLLLALYLWINDLSRFVLRKAQLTNRGPSISRPSFAWAKSGQYRLFTGGYSTVPSTGVRWLKILSLAALVLAILSRETGVIFPFLLMVFYVSFISQDRFVKSVKKAFFEASPYFGVVVVYSILRLTVLNFQNTLNFYAAPNLYSENIIYRLFTFMHVLVDYFRLLFVPTGLHMERSMVVHTSLFQWPVWLGATIIVTLLYCLIVMYRKVRVVRNVRDDGDDQFEQVKRSNISNNSNDLYAKRSNNSNKQSRVQDCTLQSDPTFRIWLFGTGWFFIGLVMVSGITPINALIYEHWLYLSMIGVWAIFSFYLVKLLDYLNHKLQTTPNKNQRFSTGQANHKQYQDSNDQNTKQRVWNFEFSNWNLFGICKLVLVVFIIFYISFLGYQSVKRNILWGNPVEFYKNIIKYEPDSVRINNNLGNQYFNRGDMEQAEVYYRKAIESGDQFAQPYYNLGSILQSRGDIVGAITEFDKAIKIDPNFYYPYQNLAVIYAQRGDFVQAVLNVEKLKLLLPSNPRVYYNSALIYIALNNKEKALIDLNEGLKYSSVDPETGNLIEKLIQQLEN
ncbi:MAG: tetratricopeptide repeat protein [Candidatus Yanofskybacteria bacterium]|nr:tetratricopeptide repeat protein [Candidatus Yanofskybacteria bacterium]